MQFVQHVSKLSLLHHEPHSVVLFALRQESQPNSQSQNLMRSLCGRSRGFELRGNTEQQRSEMQKLFAERAAVAFPLTRAQDGQLNLLENLSQISLAVEKTHFSSQLLDAGSTVPTTLCADIQLTRLVRIPPQPGAKDTIATYRKHFALKTWQILRVRALKEIS